MEFNVKLLFEERSDGWPPPAPRGADRELSVYLHKPIQRFRIDQVAEGGWVDKAREVLRSWITIDQRNIELIKGAGVSWCTFPAEYVCRGGAS